MNTLIFDVETTGLPLSMKKPPFQVKNFNTSRLIEIGYIIMNENNEIVKEYSNLIKHNDDIEIKNTHIHGISTDDVKKDGILMQDFLLEFMVDLKGVKQIMAYNIDFDYNIMMSELYRIYNKEAITVISLLYSVDKSCIMLQAMKFMKVKKYPKLIHLYKFLFNEDVKQLHRALDDVKVTLKCYFTMINLTNITKVVDFEHVETD